MLPRNFRLHLILWIFFILSFIILAFYLIFKVSGYVINFKARSVEKTGLIVLDSNPGRAEIYLNNNSQIIGLTPFEIRYLRPALYTVQIKKENYQTWEKTYNLTSEKYEQADAVLFLKDIQIQDSSESEFNKNALMKTTNIPADILSNIPKEASDTCLSDDKKSLVYRIGSEIWLYQINQTENEKNQIVARFLSDIKKIKFYPDGEHILFVIDNELHIIETSGTNDTELFDINTLDFWPSIDGNEIYLKSASKIQKITIH